MGRTTWRSLWAHKLRLAATGLAIVLGTGFVAGTLVLTDTLRTAFDSLFTAITADVDVAVQGQQSFGGTDQRRPVPAAVVERIAAVDGVAGLNADAEGTAQLLDADGEPIGGQGPPTLGFAAPTDASLAGITVRAGALPDAPGEVAIDAATAAGHDLAVGDELQVVVDGPVRTARVVGLIGFGEVDNVVGATVTVLDRETGLAAFAGEGFSQVQVRAGDGVEPDRLAARVRAVVGDDLEVLTGDELAASEAADVSGFLDFFTVALLVFATVALFVGAFLIANTFTIIVAQRTRELALLRAVGASRRQVLGSVLTEAAAVGVVGSAVGLAGGIGMAAGLRALLAAFSIDLPAAELVVAGRTVVVAMLLGVTVTVVAAVVPALRSVRVPPVAALQAVAAPPPPRFGRGRYLVGALVLAGGVALLLGGLFAGAGLGAVGGGAAVTMLGAALLSPVVTRPLVRALAAPLAILGMRGQLARDNTLRSPRRTAATASALMIGVGLVSFVMILASSLSASTEAALDDAFRADFRITPVVPAGPLGPALPASLADDLQAAPDVAAAVPVALGLVQVDGDVRLGAGVDPDRIDRVLAVDVVEGALGAVADGGLAASRTVAADRGWTLGQEIMVAFAASPPRPVPLRALLDGGLAEADIVLDRAVFAAGTGRQGAAQVYVELAGGVDPGAARARLQADVLADYPTARIQDLDEVKTTVREQIGQLLGLLSALLLLSVVIALFGITNTLGLSVLERTRELGLLRAVGASRRQVRSMVRWEAVLIAALGGVFGLVIGAVFGWLVVLALADSGITVFSLPVGQLAGAGIAAALAGVVAAILPARRAARVDILRALSVQ